MSLNKKDVNVMSIDEKQSINPTYSLSFLYEYLLSAFASACSPNTEMFPGILDVV